MTRSVRLAFLVLIAALAVGVTALHHENGNLRARTAQAAK